MYDNTKPVDFIKNPEKIRVIKLAFDQVDKDRSNFILMLNGSSIATIAETAIDDKTRSKLQSLI